MNGLYSGVAAGTANTISEVAIGDPPLFMNLVRWTLQCMHNSVIQFKVLKMETTELILRLTAGIKLLLLQTRLLLNMSYRSKWALSKLFTSPSLSQSLSYQTWLTLSTRMGTLHLPHLWVQGLRFLSSLEHCILVKKNVNGNFFSLLEDNGVYQEQNFVLGQ